MSRIFGDMTIHCSVRLKSNVAMKSGIYFCRGALRYSYCYSVHTKYVVCGVNRIFIQGYRKRWTGFETAIT